MKKAIILLLFISSIFCLFTTCKEEDDKPTPTCDFVNFKYYNGEQYYLGELSNNYIVIGVDTSYSETQIQDFISSINQFDQNYSYTIHKSTLHKFKEIPLRLNYSKTCEEITQIISYLKGCEIISYAHYAMQTDYCYNLIGEPMGNLCINSYGSDFFVKVFDTNDLSGLTQMAQKTKTEIVEQNEYLPDLFELRATKYSQGDALKMANLFFESGLFDFSEPQYGSYPVE
ncbi:MAG: hypothetical protein H6Q16_1279 [Bacteroidetes bacterium]|nr:hypothetical protein [Bacteroidota bacterium]